MMLLFGSVSITAMLFAAVLPLAGAWIASKATSLKMAIGFVLVAVGIVAHIISWTTIVGLEVMIVARVLLGFGFLQIIAISITLEDIATARNWNGWA